MANATSTQLQELYVAYFGRAADPTGLDYWTESGISTAAFAANMYAQPEFKSAYGSLSTESQVNQIYKNLFDREADVTGLTYWTQQIKLGNLQLAEIANHLVWAAQNNSGSEDDKTALSNRTNAAVAYTAKVKESTSAILAYQPLNNGLGSEDFAAGLNITEAKSFLSAIDKDTAHTAAGITASVSVITTNGVPALSTGKTYTLTTNTDTFEGTSGKDIFQGVYVDNAGTGTTIKSGDSTVGGEGVDTLNISVTGASTTQHKIEGVNADVEKILFSNYDTDTTQAQTHEFNASLADGVTTVGLSSSNDNGDTLFVNLKNIVNSEMKNGSADLTVNHIDSATKGDSDAASLTLSGAIKGASVVPTFTETAPSATGGLETLSVTSSGSANEVNITSGQNSLETVNVSGDQNLTTTITSTSLKTVDASSFTGKLDVTYAAAVDLTVKGGSGDDTVTFSANNFTSADTVDGGAGTDVLEINSPITVATLLKNVSNVETLKFADASTHDVTLAADANVMNFDFTSVGSNLLTLNTGVEGAVSATFGITGADQVNNAANVALTVKGSATAIDTSTLITGGSGTDVIEITADTEADVAINIAGGNITKVETITIVDGGDATTGSTKLSGKDVNLTTGNYATALTIDGSALDAANKDNDSDGDIDNTDTSAEKLTVDGSSATGKLTITGGGAGDSITGGTKDDTIDGGAGDDTITLTAGGKDNVKGGAGKDKFVFGSTLTKDDVVDGGDGVDTLSVTTLTAANLAGVTNVETLAFTGTATLTKDLSFDTIDLTDGSVADKVTFSTGYTKATTVKVENGDSVVNSAKIAVTVTGTASDFETADNTIITGSSSTTNDSMTLTAAGEGTADEVATTSLITNVDSITVVDAGDATTGSTALSGSDFAINLASYNTALTIDASALDAANKDNNGTGGITSADSSEEKLLIDGVASKALTVTGGAGTDTIVGSTAIDTLKGGGGVDTFTMNGNLTYEDTLDGGDGTDVLTISSAINDVDFMNVSNIETLDLDPATTNARAIALGSYFSASGVSKVLLNDGAVSTVTATGTTTGVTYVAKGNQSESITAGIGDDVFVFDGTGTLTAADTINGGAGTDTIQLDNTVDGGVSATLSLVDVTNVEKITVKDPDGGDTAGSENADAISITFDGDNGIYDATDTTDETDASVIIDASNITDTNDTVDVTATDINDDDFTFTITTGAAIDTIKSGDGADTITTNGAADVIEANGGADTVDAGDGDDSIDGGAGADTLTGGAGKDDFKYALASSESTQEKPDTITDFTTGSDEIRIAFTDPGAAGVTYDFTNKGFKSNVAEAIGLLSSKVGQYVFNTSNNQILLDTDGNGLLQSGDLAISLTGVTSLADADIAFDITTGATADTVTTGAGNDTVTAAVAGDTVTTGKGDDILTLSAAATYTGALSMGAGTDTLKVSLDAAATGVVTGVEKIEITGTKTLTVDDVNANEFNSVDGFEVVGASGTTETFAVVNTGASTTDISSIVFTNVVTKFTIDHASDDLTSGADAATFLLPGTSAIDDFTAATKIAGGTGTDILDIDTTSAVSIALGTVTGMDTLDMGTAASVTLTATQANQFGTFIGDANGSAETAIVAADTAATTMDVSAATFTNANFNVTADNAGDSIKLGAGVGDSIDIDATLTATASTVLNAGGGASDVLDINTDQAVDLSLGTVSGFETVSSGVASSGVTLSEAQADQFTATTGAEGSNITLTIVGNGAASTLDMTTGVTTTRTLRTVNIDHADDSFTLAAGIDTIVIDTGAALTASGTFKIDGKAGNDILDINTTSAINLAAGSVTNLHTLDLASGSVAANVSLTNAQYAQFTTYTLDDSDKITIVSGNGSTTTAPSAAIDTFVIGASDTAAVISAGFSVASEVDVLDLERAVTSAGFSMISAAGALDFETNGVFVGDFNITDSAANISAANLKAAFFSGNIANGDAGESAYFVSKVDHDNASSDAFVMHATVASNGTSFNTPVHIATLTNLGDLDDLTADSFLGFA